MKLLLPLLGVLAMVCVAVAQRKGGTSKSGSCPPVSDGQVGICIQGCKGDRDCPGRQKCCSNGCGTVCQDPPVCPMPRCPPNCGFRSGYNGCRECDCSKPRGPIIQTPCVKVCPADCGQRVRLDGCLECQCGELFFRPPPSPPAGYKTG